MFFNLCQINVLEVLFLCLIKLLLIILVKKSSIFFNFVGLIRGYCVSPIVNSVTMLYLNQLMSALFLLVSNCAQNKSGMVAI